MKLGAREVTATTGISARRTGVPFPTTRIAIRPAAIEVFITRTRFRITRISIRPAAIEVRITRNLSRITRMLFRITRIHVPAGRISVRLTATVFPSNGNAFQLDAKPIRSTPIEIAAA